MSRVGFYDPYLEVLGGGEKVLLTILEVVVNNSRSRVEIMSPTRPDVARWRRLNVDIDPSRVHWRRANHLSASAFSRGMDLFVVLTNHFPPLSLARHSVMILQFPFSALNDGARPLVPFRRRERALRVGSYNSVVCYSRFAAEAARERLEIASPQVISPPVDVPYAPPLLEKERKVIVVGRFFPAADANNKKHEVLIEAWRQLELTAEARGWQLHLVGGVHADRESEGYLNRLREQASGLAVRFHPNAELDELRDLYGRSAIFWHAAGYGEKQPERLEHFGITTVEAMAYRCVPVVVALGGQVEIVDDRRNGRLWRNAEELVSITRELMADTRQTGRLATEAAATAARFSKQHFIERVRAAITGPAGVKA